MYSLTTILTAVVLSTTSTSDSQLAAALLTDAAYVLTPIEEVQQVKASPYPSILDDIIDNETEFIPSEEIDVATFLTIADKKLAKVRSNPRYEGYVILGITEDKGKEYAMITRNKLEANTYGETGLPFNRPMTKKEARMMKLTNGRPNGPERRQNPSSITCAGGYSKLVVGIDYSPKQPDPGDKAQCVYSNLQDGFTAMAILINRKYVNKSIRKEFRKWQSDKKSFYRKIKSAQRKGVNVDRSYATLSIEHKMALIATWAKHEGYRDPRAVDYIVVLEEI